MSKKSSEEKTQNTVSESSSPSASEARKMWKEKVASNPTIPPISPKKEIKKESTGSSQEQSTSSELDDLKAMLPKDITFPWEERPKLKGLDLNPGDLNTIKLTEALESLLDEDNFKTKARERDKKPAAKPSAEEVFSTSLPEKKPLQEASARAHSRSDHRRNPQKVDVAKGAEFADKALPKPTSTPELLMPPAKKESKFPRSLSSSDVTANTSWVKKTADSKEPSRGGGRSRGTSIGQQRQVIEKKD
ncbi:MAG: hypothetical protein K0R63_825 [Rickettsiales bacterium]|jgi:hypothetical protein|nr:hypothetical protein [Rickettsiales bacterium]